MFLFSVNEDSRPMNKNDLFKSGRPRYLQLYERLRDQIINGIFPYGSRFLSKRVIAEQFGVSVITVEHSLELLTDEGYIESKERSGFYVTYRESDLFPGTAQVTPPENETASTQEKHNGGGDFPFPLYARTMRRVINEYGEKLMEKAPNTGVLKLRQAICSYLARSRWIHVDTDRIIIGSGAEYLYGLIIQLFGNRRSYAIESPSYEKIEQVYRANGIVPRLLPLGRHGITSASLAECDADILHISPYRSYPSGISTNAAKRREYIRWADTHKSFIIEDDFESEFSPSSKPEETVFSLAENDNVLYLNSFSKTIAPSIRIAYMLLPEQLRNRFFEKLGFYTCTVPCFEQYVLAEFIESGEFERHLNRVRRRLRMHSAM